MHGTGTFIRIIPLIFLFFFFTTGEAHGEPDPARVHRDDSGAWVVDLYFFWSERCPHCLKARPFVESLSKRLPWLRLHAEEVSRNQDNAAHYQSLAGNVGQTARSVPAFIFCGTMLTGFDTPETTGALLEEQLVGCYRFQTGSAAEAAPVTSHPPDTALTIPGGWDITTLSLPLLTVVLAGLDSFNPCAFFVLLFLLSLMVHARSRRRMLAVGGVFVFFSGLVYFLFMTAWLNLFLVLGTVQWITLGAGVIALVLGTLNIKDFFWFRQGPSVGIPEAAKPGLFSRMRGLVSAERLPAMLAGTVVLALVANSYELLCTAGFPLVFTRILTLNELSPTSYYLYLTLYNVVYIIPLLAIVGVFSLTLGSRKLSEREGRALKLLSGVMMTELGGVLVFAPAALDSALLAAALVGTALATAALLTRLRPAPGVGS